MVLSPSSPLPLGTRVFIFIFDDLGFLQNRSALSQPSSLASQQPRSGSCPGRRLRQPAHPRCFTRARCRPLQARLPGSSGARGSRRPRGSRSWSGAEATRSPASQADLEPHPQPPRHVLTPQPVPHTPGAWYLVGPLLPVLGSSPGPILPLSSEATQTVTKKEPDEGQSLSPPRQTSELLEVVPVFAPLSPRVKHPHFLQVSPG